MILSEKFIKMIRLRNPNTLVGMLSGLELWLSTTKALLPPFKGDSSEDTLSPGEVSFEDPDPFSFPEGVAAFCLLFWACLVRGGDLSSSSETTTGEVFRFECGGGFEL